MVTRNRTKGKQKRGDGQQMEKPLTVAEAARQLGVSKPHLWHVLQGNRVSHRLTRRYRELVEGAYRTAN